MILHFKYVSQSVFSMIFTILNISRYFIPSYNRWIVLHQRVKLVMLTINHNINLISDQSFIKPIYVSIEGYVLTSVLI